MQKISIEQNTTYHQSIIIIGFAFELENRTIALVIKVTVPERTCLSHEFVLEVQVPIFVFTVKFEVLALGHIVHSHNTVIFLHWVILECCNGIGHHLLKVVDLMNILGLIPDAIGLVHENQIFVLRVHHLANVVEVHVLEKNEDLHDVGCMCRACKSSLTTILHVHVLVIITITFLFESPAAAILELLWDLPPVPVVGQPR